MFDESVIGHDCNLRNLAIDTETLARNDGYRIDYLDGDGFLTWIEFASEEDMVVFKLKYMSYHLPINPWLITNV